MLSPHIRLVLDSATMTRVAIDSRSFSMHSTIEKQLLTSVLNITDTDPSLNSWDSTRNDLQANVPTASILAKLKLWHVEMNTTRGLTFGLPIPERRESNERKTMELSANHHDSLHLLYFARKQIIQEQSTSTISVHVRCFPRRLKAIVEHRMTPDASEDSSDSPTHYIEVTTRYRAKP